MHGHLCCTRKDAIYSRKISAVIGSNPAPANDLRQAKDWQKLSFSVPEIQNAYQTYLQEMERLTNGLEQRPVSCDIEDYIHEQLLNGLINKSLCESISGSMTGLGLLGTFLGLIIGLKDFSTDYDGI